MPTLTRRASETSMLEEEASETISGLKGGDRVSAAANTPNNVVVHRKEIYDHMRRESRGSKRRLAKPK